jgi:hypothetical protein
MTSWPRWLDRRVDGVSALVPSKLLCLLADDGKDALIADRFRDGGEYAVERLCDN